MASRSAPAVLTADSRKSYTLRRWQASNGQPRLPMRRRAWSSTEAMGRHAMDSKYDDEKNIEQRLKVGTHREIVGGLWEEIGTLQFEFMKRMGLRPESLLLDVGC